MGDSVLVYGSGRIARAIAAALSRSGCAVTIAARRLDHASACARAVGAAGCFAGEPASVLNDDRARSVTAIVNAAGPYSDTAPPLIGAAVGRGVDYLDAANEVEAFMAAFAAQPAAVAARTRVLPGLGFGVAAAEAVVAAACSQLLEVESVEVMFASSGGPSTTGSRATALRVLSHGAWIIETWRLRRVPVGTSPRDLRAANGSAEPLMPILNGDLLALHRSQRAPSIAVYASGTTHVRRARLALPAVVNILRNSAMRRLLGALSSPRPAGDPSSRTVTAAVTSASGITVHMSHTVPDTSSLVADLIVSALKAIQTGDVAPGTWTPYEALGEQRLRALLGMD
nr:saccharopine dehydrogenase NADP-binding domain-containing protein [Brevibacterium daeguense]